MLYYVAPGTLAMAGLSLPYIYSIGKRNKVDKALLYSLLGYNFYWLDWCSLALDGSGWFSAE
jgi:hypothetical protein